MRAPSAGTVRPALMRQDTEAKETMMPVYTVPVTMLASFQIEANDVQAAIEAAQGLIEALEPSEPFLDGWNETSAAHPVSPTRIIEASGFDYEAIYADEVEEVDEDAGCATCAASIETRCFPCDECGAMDEED